MFNKEMEVEEEIEPAQYNRHLCCSYGSLFSIALNVEYTGSASPIEQL